MPLICCFFSSNDFDEGDQYVSKEQNTTITGCLKQEEAQDALSLQIPSKGVIREIRTRAAKKHLCSMNGKDQLSKLCDKSALILMAHCDEMRKLMKKNIMEETNQMKLINLKSTLFKEYDNLMKLDLLKQKLSSISSFSLEKSN